jgi:hypothetical protein
MSKVSQRIFYGVNFCFQGVYTEVKDLDALNFHALLKSDYERKLCEHYIFKFESILLGIHRSIALDESQSSLQLRINTASLLKLLIEMSNHFSKLYSKVHILEDVKFVHLHEQMNARIYLLRVVYDIFKFSLSLFNITAPQKI